MQINDMTYLPRLIQHVKAHIVSLVVGKHCTHDIFTSINQLLFVAVYHWEYWRYTGFDSRRLHQIKAQWPSLQFTGTKTARFFVGPAGDGRVKKKVAPPPPPWHDRRPTRLLSVAQREIPASIVVPHLTHVRLFNLPHALCSILV